MSGAEAKPRGEQPGLQPAIADGLQPVSSPQEFLQKYSSERRLIPLNRLRTKTRVDRLRTNKTRVWTQEIMHVATQYSNEIINDWRKDCEFGLESIDKPPRLPTINRNFIARW